MCQVLFYKYFEVSKNIYFEDHLRTAASELKNFEISVEDFNSKHEILVQVFGAFTVETEGY